MTKSNNDGNGWRDSKVLAAVLGAAVTGLLTIVAIYVADVLDSPETKEDSNTVKSYEVKVLPEAYPFVDTQIPIEEGDIVEIRVLDANQTAWDCGLGPTNATGLIDPEMQQWTVLPSANFCALIGRVEGGPYFVAGAYESFVADVDGKLFLGANDFPTERCAPEDTCFGDNSGEQFVKITVTKD